MEERIKAIYNACWKNYKAYLADGDMAAYNIRSAGLMRRFCGKSDIRDLLLWFAPVVQEIHDRQEG